MANYNYDEGGNMSTYFLITFLVFVLIPTSISLIPTAKKENLEGCPCQPCVEQRQRNSKRGKGFNLSGKATFVTVGWGFLAFLVYRAATSSSADSKIYNPYEILGIKTGTPEKEIKSVFKKLSKQFHPDKVKATVNETLEDIQNKFVDITKAYKSLTDEVIRKNWEEFGHPDGRQETSMGIAIPQWVVAGKNNIWVLGFYGLLFGGALPAVVGRWWFGSRQKTKDGINARSASTFFKDIKEDSRITEIVGALGKSFQYENPKPVSKAEEQIELDRLEEEIAQVAGKAWVDVKKRAGLDEIDASVTSKRSLILLYAHLLRLDIQVPSLKPQQTELLLQLPSLLNALIGITISRNWLVPTVFAMRLFPFITQALLPQNHSLRLRLAQLPGIKTSEVASEEPSIKADDIDGVVAQLEEKHDGRLVDVKKAAEKWGRLEIVESEYKVIGEKNVTPSAIVYLVVKLRLSPPLGAKRPEPTPEQVKEALKFNEKKDEKFLLDKGEAESIDETNIPGFAHAPYWPGNRRPGWWLVLADDKSGRVVVPPMKINNVPYANPNAEHGRDYRTYKLQFQAPNGPGMFTWKVYMISDTFVGEEASRTMTLEIQEPSANEDDAEDEISDPEEDTIAGQMAAMRGGAVKKGAESEESDDESSTDDDESDDSDSDSDSD